MNIVTNIFEKFYTNAIKKIFIIKIFMTLEILSIFIELIMCVNKAHNDYHKNLEYSNLDFSQNYSYYILYLSPHFLIKNIYICDENKECYIPDVFFLLIILIISFLFVYIFISNYRNESNYFQEKDLNHKLYFRMFVYNFVDHFVFKIFGFSLIYILLSKILSSYNLIDHSPNILYIILGVIFLFYYIYVYHFFIMHFNLIVQIERNYHYDNMLSSYYDFVLFILKICLSIESNISKFNTDTVMIIVNILILLFSCFFSMYIIYYYFKGKILFVINNKLNRFRIFLYLAMNISIVLYFILFSKKNTLQYSILIFIIFISVIFLSILLSAKIVHKNLSNICASDDMIYILLFIINQKYTLKKEVIKSDTLKVKVNVDKKTDSTSVILFNSRIHNIFLNHKYFCKLTECEICEVRDYTYDNLLVSFNSQIYRLMNDKRFLKEFSVFKLECFEYFKLLYIHNKDLHKKVRLIYKTKVSILNNKSKPGLLNNLVLLFTFINKDIENTKKFILLKNYYSTNNYIRNSIELIEDIVISFINKNNKDLSQSAQDLNIYKDNIEKNMNTFYCYKNLYVDEYNLTIIKFVYESLFNSKAIEHLNMYSLEVMEDKLDNYFEYDKFLLLDYSMDNNYLKIIKTSHEFIEYNNRRLMDIFPLDLKKYGDSEIVKQINFSDKLMFKFDCIVNYDYNIRFMTFKDAAILPSMEDNNLLITTNYDLDDTELILTEGGKIIEDIKFFHCKDILMDQLMNYVLINYSPDIFKILFLDPLWIKSIKTTKYRWKLQIGKIFELENKKKKSNNCTNEFMLTLNYRTYIDLYTSIIDILKEIPDFNTPEYISKFAECQHSIKLLAIANKTIPFEPIKKIEISYLDSVYIAYKLKKLKQFSCLNEFSETIESTKSNNKLNETRQGTVNTASSSSNILSTSNKKISDYNNNKLTRYTILTLVFNVSLILYCLIYLFVGITNNSRFENLFNIRLKFLNFKNSLQHTLLSLLFLVDIVDLNDEKYKLNIYERHELNIYEYFSSEIKYKIDILTDISNSFELSIYHYNYNQDLQNIYSKELNYTYFTIVNNEIQVKTKSINYLTVIRFFINNCKVIDEIINKNNIYLYIVDVQDHKLVFPKKVDIDKIPRYIISMYEVIMNFHNYLSLTTYVENEINVEHLSNINMLFTVNFYLTLILILVHSVLIFICYRIIISLDQILADNIKMINNILQNDNIKYLKVKLSNLKKLIELYSTNPSEILSNLKNTSSSYTEAIKKEKFKEMKNEKSNEYASLISKKNFEFIINRKIIIRPFTNILIITFSIYFVYSIALYAIFYIMYTKIEKTTEYLFTNSDIIDSIQSNAIILKTMMILNKTDLDTTKLITGELNPIQGYVQEKINNFYEGINKLKRNKLNSDVNYYYELYGDSIINCNDSYALFNDSIIYQTINGNNDKLKNIIEICNDYPVMKTDIDQIYSEIIYNYQIILHKYISSNYKYNNVKDIFKHDGFLKNSYLFLLLVFRPIQFFITSNINISAIYFVNHNYLIFTFVYLSLNILVDLVLCLIIYKNILQKSSNLNRYYNSMINSLKV